MFGKIVLWLRRVWKQQTCIHDWKVVHAAYRNDGSCADFDQCKKCEYIK